MPKVCVYEVSSLNGEGKHIVGTLSYKPEDSYADARLNMERMKYFDFAYDFVDDTANDRMQVAWEKGNMLEDAGGILTIISKQASGKVADEAFQRLRKSNTHAQMQSMATSESPSSVPRGAGQSGSSPTRQLEPLESRREWHPSRRTQEPVSVEAAPPLQAIEVDPHVSLLSETMSPKLKVLLEIEIAKFREHLATCKLEDMDWCVKSFDKCGTAVVGIWCGECHSNSNASKKGAMVDKASIRTCFANFRNGHMVTSKHIRSMAANKGEIIDSSELKRRVNAATESAKQVLDEHLAIVEEWNSSQSTESTGQSTVGSALFTIVGLGQVDAENMELSKLKIYCNVCENHMVLVPRQRNLQSNLESHVNGKKHLDLVRKRQRPPISEPVCTGKAGRPRKDTRDNKQPRIDHFLPMSRGGEGSSSGSQPSHKGKGSELPHIDSLLCWGLWKESYKYGVHRRLVKPLLDDQDSLEAQWYAEPHVQREVWSMSEQRSCVVEGLFRHRKCNRMSALGGGFTGLTCEMCWSILSEPDFRLRVFRESEAREKRGTRTTGLGRRLGYLTLTEAQEQCRSYRSALLKLKKKERQFKHRILMLQRRDPRLRDLCVDSANKNDILKFCNSLTLAHKRGAFGGKGALWDLLRDIVANLSRPSKGARWRPGTKVLMQTLFQLGGRRVINCLSLNSIGPSLNTLQRDRRGMIVFRAGIQADQFKFIAQLYSAVKARLGINGPVPCYLAEDETCIKRTVRWLPRHDTLIGFCGKHAENHQCVTGLEIPVGNLEAGFEAIAQAFQSHKIGHQARCVIVNPLVEGFPKLCLLATSTCGKFDANWVKSQWEILTTMWNAHCLKDVGPLLGHASDGDARRRKLMIADYTGQGISGRRQNLEWEGWVLSHSIHSVDGLTYASGLHDQDYIHNGKKLVNPLDSVTRTLQMGTGVAELGHLVTISTLYDLEDHKLNAEDTKRTDRQNWASAQRLSSRKVTSTLRKCRLRKDARVELTLGTEMYLTICGDYIDIFLNTTLTLRERVVLCGKVSFFFRLWRLWCFHGNHSVGGNTQPISFARNCVPMQTFLDIQISVHFAVLLIIQFRDNYRDLPVPLQLTGSDVCEQFFSKVGGMKGHERSYDISELIDCATSLNRLAALDTSDGLVGIGKSHKKHSNIWMKIHKEPGGTEVVADQTDYSGIETNPEIVHALKEGFLLAQNACVSLEMNPTTSARDQMWWKTPWLVEAKGVKFGGFGDVNMDALTASDPDSSLDDREPVVEESDQEQQVLESEEELQNVQLEGGEVEDSLSTDVVVARDEVHETMSCLYTAILYSDERRDDVDPTVSYEGRKMYKSTLISQLNVNPHLSKDRLTRVKSGLYFNNLVDKPKVRDGTPTMFIYVGSDCAVYFTEEVAPPRATRGNLAIANERKGKRNSKKARVEPADVGVVPTASIKHLYWIGKVQSIQKKYGSKIGRCRDPIDLLDRPSDDAVCKVKFNWFTQHGESGLKYKYNHTDPQLIDLSSVITAVSLSMDERIAGIYNLDNDDHKTIIEFLANK